MRDSTSSDHRELLQFVEPLSQLAAEKSKTKGSGIVAHETPESLLNFFSSLSVASAGETKCEIHYGCQCIVQKGKMAAEMLVAIQRTLRLDPLTETREPIPVPPATESATPAAEAPLAGELAAEKQKTSQLIKQNLKLVNDNEALKQKIQSLQRQVNRLLDRFEAEELLHKIPTADNGNPIVEPTLTKGMVESENAARIAEVSVPAPPLSIDRKKDIESES